MTITSILPLCDILRVKKLAVFLVLNPIELHHSPKTKKPFPCYHIRMTTYAQTLRYHQCKYLDDRTDGIGTK